MPLTLPTHPIAVIPLLFWRPRWFDGVALVVGAISPDVAFAFAGYGITINSHAWHAVIWWTVPIALVSVRLIQWAAPTVAAHLPAGGVLALDDYGAVGVFRHRWWITVSSAMLGAASHLVWDAFTHPAAFGGDVLFPALRGEAWPGMPWWYLLSLASDAFGFVAGGALIVYIGRRRLIRTWYGPAPAVQRRPALFWGAGAVVLAMGLATLPVQPMRHFPDQSIRTMLAGCLALLAGTAAVRWASRDQEMATAQRY